MFHNNEGLLPKIPSQKNYMKKKKDSITLCVQTLPNIDFPIFKMANFF